MASDSDDRSSAALSPEERRWLERVRAAGSLSQLREITGTDTDHDAYIEAKPTWERLRGRELGTPTPAEGLPGDRVVVDGQPFPGRLCLDVGVVIGVGACDLPEL